MHSPIPGGHGAAARLFSAKIAATYVKKKLMLRNSTRFFTFLQNVLDPYGSLVPHAYAINPA